MSEFVRWFLAIQVMAGVGWLCSLAVRRAGLSATNTLRLCRVLVLAALLLPLLVATVALQTSWIPEVQLWSALERLGVAPVTLSLRPGTPTSWSLGMASLPSQPWPFMLYGSVLLACVWSLLSWMTLRAMVRRSTFQREVDGVEVFVSDEVRVPFAVWLPGRSIVIMDHGTWEHPVDFDISLAHERQHHAERDPVFAYVSIVFQSLCVFNPFAHFWMEFLHDQEEFACDERVLLTSSVRPKDYALCLLRAAGRAAEIDAGAFGVALTRKGRESLLHRRIRNIGRARRDSARLWPAVLGSLCVMASTAWIVDASIIGPGMGRVALQQLSSQAPVLEIGRPPSDMLDHALFELGGMPENNRFVRRALFRGSGDLEMMERLLRERGLPRELAAIPLVESGLTPHRPRDGSDRAGRWQLVPSQARAYGLVVEDGRDQRMDLELETLAAMQLLTDLHAEFGDWALAVAAFHEGAYHVRRAIRQQGTRDVWELMRARAINRYPMLVIAAALMTEQPHLLRQRG